MGQEIKNRREHLIEIETRFPGLDQIRFSSTKDSGHTITLSVLDMLKKAMTITEVKGEKTGDYPWADLREEFTLNSDTEGLLGRGGKILLAVIEQKEKDDVILGLTFESPENPTKHALLSWWVKDGKTKALFADFTDDNVPKKHYLGQEVKMELNFVHNIFSLHPANSPSDNNTIRFFGTSELSHILESERIHQQIGGLNVYKPEYNPEKNILGFVVDGLRTDGRSLEFYLPKAMKITPSTKA